MARSSPSRSRHRHYQSQQQQHPHHHHRHRHRRHSSRDRSPPYPYPVPDSNHKARKASEPSSSSACHSDAAFSQRHRYHHREANGSRHWPPLHRRETNPSRNPSSSSSSSCKSAEEAPASDSVINRSPKRRDSRSGNALRPSSDLTPAGAAVMPERKAVEAREEGSRSRSDATPKQHQVVDLKVQEQDLLQGGECSNRSSNRKRAVWELACALAHAYVSQLDSSRRTVAKEAEEPPCNGYGKNAENGGLSKRLAVRHEPGASTSASSSSPLPSKLLVTIAAETEPSKLLVAIAAETEPSPSPSKHTVVAEAEPPPPSDKCLNTVFLEKAAESSSPSASSSSPPALPPRFESQSSKEPLLAQTQALPCTVHEEEAPNEENTKSLHQKTEFARQEGDQLREPQVMDSAEPWRADFTVASDSSGAVNQTTRRKRQRMVIDLNLMPMDENDEGENEGNEEKEEVLDLNTKPRKSGIDLNAEPGEWGSKGSCAMEEEEEEERAGRGREGAKPVAVKEWLGKYFPSTAAAMVS